MKTMLTLILVAAWAVPALGQTDEAENVMPPGPQMDVLAGAPPPPDFEPEPVLESRSAAGDLSLEAAKTSGQAAQSEEKPKRTAPPATPPVQAVPDAGGSVASPSTSVAASAGTVALVANSQTLSNGLLRLNFRGVALDQVLTYLSEAAGFIIVLDATPRGKVDVWSNTPVTREEAVDLLNSVLNRNGLAAIRNERTLTIVNKDEAKTKHLPVKEGANPANIPNNDEMVTQILPVRFVEVAQLIKDLQPLVATTTSMTANEAANSIVMTDTQANIRRVAEIIQAIDQSAEDVTEVEVFRLQYADPTEMATLLTSVFPDESKSSGSQSPVQFGGRGFPGMFGGRGGGGNQSSSSTGDQTSRIKKRSRVIAVADARTQSVIVSTASGLMDQIRNMVTQLDSNPAKKQKVFVYSLENADAQQVETVLQEMFETTTTRNNSRNSQNQNNVLQNRANQSQTSSGSGTTSRNSSRSGNSGGGGF
jgi:general secretion pathway protein D